MIDNCFRCGKPATIRLPKMRVNLCSYCAAVAATELNVALPVPSHVKPVRKINPRRKRYWQIVISAIALMVLLVTTAALTIQHDGWNFFVQRSAGVGSTSDNGPSEHKTQHPTPTPTHKGKS